jgi:predicted transcriptional regulator
MTDDWSRHGFFLKSSRKGIMGMQLDSKALRSMRKRAGFSQWRLAKSLGRTQGWLSNIELGYVTPHETVLAKIARAIEMLKKDRSQIHSATKGSANSQCECDL